MKNIKIIAGGYGYRPEGAKSVTLITKHHAPVAVPDAEAERLVQLGVAKIVESNIPLVRPDDGYQIFEYSMKNRADELKALMDKFELPYEDGITKRQMVDALDEFFESVEDEEDDKLNLGAHDTVVE